jgi:hypothetical protein
LQHPFARDAFTVGEAFKPRDAGAGRGDRRKAELLDDSSTDGVPRIDEDDGISGAVKGSKLFGFFTLCRHAE